MNLLTPMAHKRMAWPPVIKHTVREIIPSPRLPQTHQHAPYHQRHHSPSAHPNTPVRVVVYDNHENYRKDAAFRRYITNWADEGMRGVLVQQMSNAIAAKQLVLVYDMDSEMDKDPIQMSLGL